MDNRTQVTKIDFELWESEFHPRGNEFLLVGLAVLAAAFMVGFVVFVL